MKVCMRKIDTLENLCVCVTLLDSDNSAYYKFLELL